VEEEFEEEGTVLDMEGHRLVFRTGATGLTGMNDWSDRSSLTDRQIVQKWTISSLRKIWWKRSEWISNLTRKTNSMKWLEIERNEGDIEEIPQMNFQGLPRELEDNDKWFLSIKGFEDGVRIFQDKLRSILDLGSNWL
jgi:hypothetical protein